MRRPMMALALAGLLTLTLGLGATLATSAVRSTELVVQTWDGTQVGTSTLVRTDSGYQRQLQELRPAARRAPGAGCPAAAAGARRRPLARPELHLAYNLAETLPLLVGLGWQWRRWNRAPRVATGTA